jgi:hypothetical protein
LLGTNYTSKKLQPMSKALEKEIKGVETYEALNERSNLPKYLGGLVGFLSFPGGKFCLNVKTTN